MVKGFKIRLWCSSAHIWCDTAKEVMDSLDADLLSELTVGETVTVEAAEMTEEQRANLGDFEGW